MKRKNTRVIPLMIIMSLMIIPLFGFYVTNGKGQAYHAEADIPAVRPILEDKKITWKIINASGVYADPNTQPNDLIRYEVDEVDVINEEYKIEAERKMWGKNDFTDEDYTTPTYYLVNRRWGQITVDYFEEQDNPYWTETNTTQAYKLEYLTEWYNGFLINTVKISYMINKNNYDIIKYTREEGILLSRKAVINVNDGADIGYCNIELHSYSGMFIVSPWWYIIVIAIIIGVVAAVLVIISQIIRRRKRMWQEIDEI